MKKILDEGNQIHNFISSSGSGTVINYGSGSDFLTSYGSSSGSGSTSQKVTVPTVPVPVPQHCPTLMESTAHFFSGVMFYKLQSSAYFLNAMLIVNSQPLLSLSSTHLKLGLLIVLAAEK
jgi:hypothetical protein